MKTWILVADSSNARIYSIPNKAQLFQGDGKKISLISQYKHPNSRKKDHELVTDKQGRMNHTAQVAATDPQKHEEEVFAIELTKQLHKAHSDHHYQELIFIAPAAFMGLLNKHLHDSVSKLVNLKIEKDYTQCSESELIANMQDYL